MTPDRVDLPASVAALSHLGAANAAVNALANDDVVTAGSLSLDDMATLAHGLDLLLAAAKDIRSDLTTALAAEMGEPHVHTGPYVLECRTGSSRKRWASDSLLGELAARSTVDPETGERLDDGRRFDRFFALVRACVPFTGSLGWRAGALREVAGVDPDEWCDVEPGRVTVSVHVAEPGEVAA